MHEQEYLVFRDVLISLLSAIVAVCPATIPTSILHSAHQLLFARLSPSGRYSEVGRSWVFGRGDKMSMWRVEEGEGVVEEPYE